jgi:undecaprenyl diphosphate synthase
LADLPEPDLFIRTGGEQRISNFLLWQLAYTELHFTPLLWPEFNETAFEAALASFASRQRRFGQTGDQIENPSTP